MSRDAAGADGGFKGTQVATAHSFEEETAPAVHEQLARLQFAESKLDFHDKRILDFGCGTGYNCYFLSERQSPREVVGIDLMEDCIVYCREHYQTDRTRFEVRDCLVHDPTLGAFDVVVSCEVLEHVAEQSQFLKVLGQSMAPEGRAFVTTPNRAVFSLTKSKSFNNKTHIKELFYDEFEQTISAAFGQYQIYSQIHKGEWHDAYVNQLCMMNLLLVLRHDIFGDGLAGKLSRALTKRLLAKPMARFASKDYPDVRKRRYTDFDFVEGHHNLAAWFVAVCSDPV